MDILHLAYILMGFLLLKSMGTGMHIYVYAHTSKRNIIPIYRYVYVYIYRISVVDVQDPYPLVSP
jgi:hypothetical protein